jgi:hypothetical protein
MKSRTRLFAIIGIVVILLVGTYYIPTTTLAYSDSQKEKAINYLTGVMFVPSIGLDKCSPIVETNTIWLTNDNLLAYAVLLELNNPMATTLKQSLDQYGISGNGLVEVALNKTIEPIRASNHYDIATIGQYTIKNDARDGGVMYDFNEYADLCFWWCQNLLLKNDINGAISNFNQGMSMWNGIGFVDKPFNGEYQTYKVGLALWIAERINYTTNGNLYQRTSFNETTYSEMQNIIWSLQDPANGGIHTGYTSTSGTISSNTDTNVETTSICLLYLTVPCPLPPFSIMASHDSHSTITPNGEQIVNYGDNITFTYLAQSGYHLSSVKVDGIDVLSTYPDSYTFNNVIANHIISVLSEENPTYILNLEITSTTNNLYQTNTIPLNYNAFTNGTGLSVKYSLNNQANISLSGNTTLTELPNGQYNIVLYASNDQGNQDNKNVSFQVNVPTYIPEITLSALLIALIVGTSAVIYYKKKSKSNIAKSNLP